MNPTQPANLRLVRPSERYAEEIGAFRQESLAIERQINGSYGLSEYEDPSRWIAWCELCADPATLPQGLVQADQWLLVRDDEIRVLGMINIRHSLGTDNLREFGGHIGYSIRPAERRQGLAKAQLRLGLEKCRDLEINPVLLTCDAINEASRRTILACGGLFDRPTTKIENNLPTPMERYWIPL